jgi:hypothetical protein
MIRSALHRLAEKGSPAWLVRRIPDALWNWAFEVTPTEALMQKAFCDLQARPDITVYDYDGQNRRTANPFATMQRSMAAIADAAKKMGDNITAMFTDLRERILTPELSAPERRAWFDDGIMPERHIRP